MKVESEEVMVLVLQAVQEVRVVVFVMGNLEVDTVMKVEFWAVEVMGTRVVPVLGVMVDPERVELVEPGRVEPGMVEPGMVEPGKVELGRTVEPGRMEVELWVEVVEPDKELVKELVNELVVPVVKELVVPVVVNELVVPVVVAVKEELN